MRCFFNWKRQVNCHHQFVHGEWMVHSVNWVCSYKKSGPCWKQNWWVKLASPTVLCTNKPNVPYMKVKYSKKTIQISDTYVKLPPGNLFTHACESAIPWELCGCMIFLSSLLLPFMTRRHNIRYGSKIHYKSYWQHKVPSQKRKKRERSNINAVIARMMSLIHGFLQLLPFCLLRFFLKVCNFISTPCPQVL
jgi:hypothetical protein